MHDLTIEDTNPMVGDRVLVYAAPRTEIWMEITIRSWRHGELTCYLDLIRSLYPTINDLEAFMGRRNISIY